MQQELVEAFVAAFGAAAARIRVGDPSAQETQMGPVISAAALERIESYVAGAQDEGAALVTGGQRPGLAAPLERGHFYAPTILFTEDPQIRVAQEEIFGPVVTIIPFETEDDAVAIANGVPYGLGAAIWTRDVARAHRVARWLRSGTIWINDYHRVDPGSPWGGFRLSGYGRENGLEAIRMFTEVKSTWVRLSEPAPGWYESSDRERLS